MRTLPTPMIRLLAPFAPLFSKSVWQNAQVLLMGAFPQPRVEGLSPKFCSKIARHRLGGKCASTPRASASAHG